jgi:SAM-dependent methyltransferase
LLAHDDIYDASYYESVEQTAADSAGPMAATILRDLAPTSVLDVGCGTGALLATIQAHGVRAVRGLEYSADGLARCRERGVEVAPFDLEHDSSGPVTPAHVVVSLEVAEHLGAKFADRYADLMACHVAPGGWLVFTAATPGQGGKGHVNEQPHRYWIEKMRARGLRYDAQRSLAWRAEWTGNVARWYSANLMLFQRERDQVIAATADRA